MRHKYANAQTVSAALMLTAMICAIAAQYRIHTARDLDTAAPVALAALLAWLVGISLQSASGPRGTTSLFNASVVQPMSLPNRGLLLIAGLIMTQLTFLTAYEGRFTFPLLALWLGGIVLWWLLLHPGPRSFRFRTPVHPRLNAETGLFILFLTVGAAGLFLGLDTAPDGMIGDHVEKIIDLYRIRGGEYYTYFGANSGREPFHFYAAYAVSMVTGELSFLSLKIVSALMGLLTLPAMYWLGRRANGSTGGLMAMGLGAAAIWLMISARIGFRAEGSAMMSTLLLAVYWKALESNQRQDFLSGGIILGAGQYTYTAFRVTPVLIAVGLLLALLAAPRQERLRLVRNTAAMLVMALVVYLPLLAFWVRYPEVYWFRSQRLIGDNAGSSIQLLINGLIDSVTMFNWTQDPVLLNVVRGWPALDPVTGGLMPLGFILSITLAFRRRQPLALLLPAALLIFILPSALGISTPREMPSVRRAIMAMPVATVLAGLALGFVIEAAWRAAPKRRFRLLIAAGSAALLILHGALSWTAYFNRYVPLYNHANATARLAASEINAFEELGGRLENVYLLIEPTNPWIDSRAVAIWLGRLNEWDNVYLVEDAERCTLAHPPNQPIMLLYGFNQLETEQWVQNCIEDNFIQRVYYDPVSPVFDVVNFIVTYP